MSRYKKQLKNERHKPPVDTIFKNPKHIFERPGLQQIDVPAGQHIFQFDPQPLMSLQVPQDNHQSSCNFPSPGRPASLLGLNIPRPGGSIKKQNMFDCRNTQFSPRPRYPPKLIPNNQPKHTNATPKISANLTSKHGIKAQPLQLNQSTNPGNKSTSHVGSSTQGEKPTYPLKDNSAYTEHLKKLKRKSTACENTKEKGGDVLHISAKSLKLEPDVSTPSSLKSIEFPQTKLNPTQSAQEDIDNDATSTKDTVVNAQPLQDTSSRIHIKKEYVAEQKEQKKSTSAHSGHLKKLKEEDNTSMKQCKKIHQHNIAGTESLKNQGKVPSLKLSPQSSQVEISQNLREIVCSTGTLANVASEVQPANITCETQPKASHSPVLSENPYEKCLKPVVEQNDNAADQPSPARPSSPYTSHLKKLKRDGNKPMEAGYGKKSVTCTKQGDTDHKDSNASVLNKKKSSPVNVVADTSRSSCNKMRNISEKSANLPKCVGKTAPSKPMYKGRAGDANIPNANKLTKVVLGGNTSKKSGKLSVVTSNTAGHAKERPLLDDVTRKQNSDYFKIQSEAYDAHLKKLKKASRRPVPSSNEDVGKKAIGSALAKTVMSNRQSTNESVPQFTNSQLTIPNLPKAIAHSTGSPSKGGSYGMKNESKSSVKGAGKPKSTSLHTNENTGKKTHSKVSNTVSTNRQNVNKSAPNSKKATVHAKATSSPKYTVNNNSCDASKDNSRSQEGYLKQVSQKQEESNTNASKNLTITQHHADKSGPESKILPLMYPRKLGSNAERKTNVGYSAKFGPSHTVPDIPSLLSLTLERPKPITSSDHVASRCASKHIASTKHSVSSKIVQSTRQPIAVPGTSKQTILQTSPSISSVQRSVASCSIPSILSISPDQDSTQTSTMALMPSVDFTSLSDSPTTSALDGFYRPPSFSHVKTGIHYGQRAVAKPTGKTSITNSNLIPCVPKEGYDFIDKKTSRDPVSQPEKGPLHNKPRHTVMDKIKEIRKDKEESDRFIKTDTAAVKDRVSIEQSSAGHYPLLQQDEYITIDTTGGENDSQSKNSQAGTTDKKVPVASDFFSDPDELACAMEPPKPVVKGILKRQSYGERQLANSKRPRKDEPASCSELTTCPKIRPKLHVENDTIIAVPSIKKEGADAFANMSIDSAIAAGVQFLQPVSGYNCVLCRTFYCDYPTALHHCTLLGHKMKVLKELSPKKNAAADAQS